MTRGAKPPVEVDEADADDAVGWKSEASEAYDMDGVCERPAWTGARDSSVARLR